MNGKVGIFMKKIKWLFIYILVFFIPVIVFADNEFGLSEDYLYYCKYDFVTMINGGGKLENEAERHFPFYLYVYQNEVVPIIKYEHLPAFYNMKNYPAGEVIIDLGDAPTAKFSYSDLESFFDKDSVHCPTLYVSSDGYTDYITAYSVQNSKAYQSVESKKGNLGSNLGEVTYGKKMSIVHHFTSDGNLNDIKDTTLNINFFYNSKGQKCMSVSGITDCQDDPSHILVPIQMVKTGGGVINVDFLFDGSTGNEVYLNNNFETFNKNVDLHLFARKSGNHVLVLISTKYEASDIPIEEGEGTKGEIGSGGSSGGNQGYKPTNPCEGDNCNISLNGFCSLNTVARTLKFLGLLFVILKILVPAIIIIFGFIDLFHVISSGKYEDAKKYTTSIVKRIFIGVIIFLLPSIVQFVFQTASDLINNGEEGNFDNCVTCIMEPDACKVNVKE